MRLSLGDIHQPVLQINQTYQIDQTTPTWRGTFVRSGSCWVDVSPSTSRGNQNVPTFLFSHLGPLFLALPNVDIQEYMKKHIAPLSGMGPC